MGFRMVAGPAGCIAASRDPAVPLAGGAHQSVAGLTERRAGQGLWPRIRPIPRADSSDFARNPAAGLSSISSV
jgi:hypothetical protein